MARAKCLVGLSASGLAWKPHKAHFGQPASHKLAAEFDILALNLKSGGIKEISALRKSALGNSLNGGRSP